MTHYFATVTRRDGAAFFPAGTNQFEIGAWSAAERMETLKEIQNSGYADLEHCSVELYETKGE